MTKETCYAGIKEIIEQEVTKNFSILISAQLVYKLLSFLTFIIIARSLGASNFGQLSYAISFVAIFIYFIDFGLSSLMIRDVAGEIKDKVGLYLNNILTLKLVLSAILYLATILTASFIEKDKIIFNAILILGLALVLDSYSISFKSTFNLYSFSKRYDVKVEKFLFLVLYSRLFTSVIRQ